MTSTARLNGLAYSALLLLYPRNLRRHFGREMVEVFHHEVQDAYQKDGWAGGVRIWLRAGVEILTVALPSHLRLVGVSVLSCLSALSLFYVILRLTTGPR